MVSKNYILSGTVETTEVWTGVYSYDFQTLQVTETRQEIFTKEIVFEFFVYLNVIIQVIILLFFINKLLKWKKLY